MTSHIHPTAIVDPAATIGENVSIGPFSIVEGDVVIGDHCEIRSHVVLANGARLGSHVRVHTGAVIATEPQDLKFDGSPSLAVVGSRTVIREFVTINRGTSASGKTVVGDDVLLMAYVHVAHDCIVGNRVIIANATQLGGHVAVDDWAIIGGVTAVHQFSKIGAHSMIGGGFRVTKDVPPYTLASREPLCAEGLNVVGLRRRGFSNADIAALDAFYRHLYRGGLNVTDALSAYESAHSTMHPLVQGCIDFIRSSKRGIVRSAG